MYCPFASAEMTVAGIGDVRSSRYKEGRRAHICFQGTAMRHFRRCMCPKYGFKYALTMRDIPGAKWVEILHFMATIKCNAWINIIKVCPGCKVRGSVQHNLTLQAEWPYIRSLLPTISSTKHWHFIRKYLTSLDLISGMHCTKLPKETYLLPNLSSF